MRVPSEDLAEPWLAQGLRAAGIDTVTLKRLKGSDPRNLALAGLLRQRTTVSQKCIATRLAMHSTVNVSQHLRRLD